MKTIYIFKFYVVLNCLICKPNDYTYNVYNAKYPADSGSMHTTVSYNKGDTIVIMEEKQIKVQINHIGNP